MDLPNILEDPVVKVVKYKLRKIPTEKNPMVRKMGCVQCTNESFIESIGTLVFKSSS